MTHKLRANADNWRDVALRTVRAAEHDSEMPKSLTVTASAEKSRLILYERRPCIACSSRPALACRALWRCNLSGPKPIYFIDSGIERRFFLDLSMEKVRSDLVSAI